MGWWGFGGWDRNIGDEDWKTWATKPDCEFGAREAEVWETNSWKGWRSCGWSKVRVEETDGYCCSRLLEHCRVL